MAKALSELSLNLCLESAVPPVVMGVLNVTPDSFSDGGQFFEKSTLQLNRVQDVAAQMVVDGAQILDVGGESTRPGAQSVSDQQEADRVLPVLEAIASLNVVVSLDGSRPALMQAGAALGVGLINDVRALEQPNAVEMVAKLGLPVCLMHMQGTPQTMQVKPSYGDLINDVERYLLGRAEICEAAGIAANDILLDPGFGFGKTLDHNLVLLRTLSKLGGGKYSLLAGLSRKSMIDHVHQALGGVCGVNERLSGSLALALLAAQNGAAIIRVHDVKETVSALNVYQAYRDIDL